MERRSQAFSVVLIMYLFKTVHGGHDKRIACIQCGVHFAKKCRSGEVFYILCSRVLWLESNSRFASIAQLLPIVTMAAAAATTPGKYPDPPYNSETDASCLQCFFPECRMQRKGYASMMSHCKQDHTEGRVPEEWKETWFYKQARDVENITRRKRERKKNAARKCREENEEQEMQEKHRGQDSLFVILFRFVFDKAFFHGAWRGAPFGAFYSFRIILCS